MVILLKIKPPRDFMHYTQPKILIISQFDENIKKYLKNDYTTVIIKEYKSIENVLTTHTPQIVILDDKYILNPKYSEFKLIKYHPIFNDLPVLSISQNLDDEKNLKLHSLGLRGVLSLEYSEDKIKSMINAILNRSNPNVGSPKDWVIKSFVRYNNMTDEIKEPIYLAEYLLNHYNIDAVNGAIIKDAIKLLTVAKHSNSLQNIKNFIHDLAISKQLDEMIKNVDTPSSIYDKILYYCITPQEDYIDFKRGNSLNMKNVSIQAKKLNKVPISTSHDIYIFWEKASEIILKQEYLNLETIDKYLKFIFKILYRALSIRNEIIAHIDASSNNEYIIIQITPKDCSNQEIDDCINEINPSYDLIKLNATLGEQSRPGVDILFTKNPKQKEEEKNSNIEKTAETKESKQESKIDREHLDTMHYGDHERVSAVEFAKEFSVDSDTIADLNDIEQEATDALYLKDKLTQETIDIVASTLKNYMRILNQTVEFQNIAFAIGSLVSLLETLVIDELNSDKSDEFKAYLTGIVNDLSQWKEHIFIYQNTNDIHYLDASLFENCKTIENIVNCVEIEDDEDDLEFF